MKILDEKIETHNWDVNLWKGIMVYGSKEFLVLDEFGRLDF